MDILINALRAAIEQNAIVFALAAIGLNVHFGYTGLLNFGQIGFLAIAAYGVAVTVQTFELSLWVGVLVGIAGAVLLALLLGIPTLRLRADYLAIATIAASEIIRLVARSTALRDVTGGSSGLTGFAADFYTLNPLPAGSYGPFGLDADTMFKLTVGWILVALAALLVFMLMRSPWGRVLKSIREDEDAARSLGKNVYSYKMQSLILGGVIGAFGGMFGAIGTQSVQPDAFSTQVTFFAYTVLILGGTARVLGPVIGSMIFWALLSVTENFLIEFFGGADLGIFRLMLVGAGLMLLMIFRPQGIFGDRKELALDAR